VEQKLLSLLGHLSSTPVFSGVRFARFLVFYSVVFPFVLFLLAIVLSVLDFIQSLKDGIYDTMSQTNK